MIPPKGSLSVRHRPATASEPSLTGFLLLAGLLAGIASFSGPLRANEPGNEAFTPIYRLLEANCSGCHVQGVADGPWSLNTPPTADRFPECLPHAGYAGLQCATYHELVDPPGPGIPAWIRPADGPASEPYAQACDPAASFHIGHSIPDSLSAEDCGRFLDWIESGAPP